MVDTGKLTAPSDWQTDRDPINIAVLGKLAEELGELQSAVARCIIQGIDEPHPITGKSNRAWLEEEMTDVRAMMRLNEDHFKLEGDAARFMEKLNHKRAWLKLIRPVVCVHPSTKLSQHQGGKITCGVCGVEVTPQI